MSIVNVEGEILNIETAEGYIYDFYVGVINIKISASNGTAYSETFRIPLCDCGDEEFKIVVQNIEDFLKGKIAYFEDTENNYSFGNLERCLCELLEHNFYEEYIEYQDKRLIDYLNEYGLLKIVYDYGYLHRGIVNGEPRDISVIKANVYYGDSVELTYDIELNLPYDRTKSYCEAYEMYYKIFNTNFTVCASPGFGPAWKALHEQTLKTLKNFHAVESLNTVFVKVEETENNKGLFVHGCEGYGWVHCEDLNKDTMRMRCKDDLDGARSFIVNKQDITICEKQEAFRETTNRNSK